MGDILLGPPSDLFRRMVGACRKKLAEYEFIRLQPRMARRGVFSEKDVEKLVLEDR